jgi:hypothetical protein
VTDEQLLDALELILAADGAPRIELNGTYECGDSAVTVVTLNDDGEDNLSYNLWGGGLRHALTKAIKHIIALQKDGEL